MTPPSPLHQDFRALSFLFFALRVALLVAFVPVLLETNDPDVPEVLLGLTQLGDFYEHYTYAEAVRTDNLPYRDYWVEFPPVWITLTTLTYQLAPSFTRFAGILYFLFLACDYGVLNVVYQLAKQMYGKNVALGLAWVYAFYPLTIIMLAWNFEVLASLTIVAGLYFWIRHKPLPAALALIIGILTKYLAGFVGLTMWRFAPRREALLYTLGVGAGVLLVLGPLVAWGGQMALTSLTVQGQKASYQSVWALMDGNYRSGTFPQGEARYDASAQAVRELGNRPVVPFWGRALLMGAVFLWLWLAPGNDSPLNRLRFLTASIIIFLLGSGGWSPQWMISLTPLLLLCFPSRVGLLLVLVLTMGALLEFPALFIASQVDGSTIAEPYRPLFALSILLRTFILAAIVAVLRNDLAQSATKQSEGQHELTPQHAH